jgi:hypothetical protein
MKSPSIFKQINLFQCNHSATIFYGGCTCPKSYGIYLELLQCNLVQPIFIVELIYRGNRGKYINIGKGDALDALVALFFREYPSWMI